MANKRMFNKCILCSDAYLNLSKEAQALYIQLCIRADDDGFIDNSKSITRLIGLTEDTLKELESKRFILTFSKSGVVLIKHWLLHNTINEKYYNPTKYQSLTELVFIKNNLCYTLGKEKGKPFKERDKIRLDKIRLDKESKEINKESIETPKTDKPNENESWEDIMSDLGYGDKK